MPPLLVFGVPMMFGETQDSVSAAVSAVRQATEAGPKPWLRWLGRVALWVGKALASTAATVIVRYWLLQRQVRRSALSRTPGLAAICSATIRIVRTRAFVLGRGCAQCSRAPTMMGACAVRKAHAHP